MARREVITLSEKHNSAVIHRRNYRKALSLRLFCFVLINYSLAISSLIAEEIIFDRYDVVIGYAERQTVLAGYLFDDNIADLTILNINQNGDRHLRIYTFLDSTWTQNLEATLRDEVLFVDIANIHGHDRLITYKSGQLNWFNPKSMTEHLLVPVTSTFDPPHKNEIPYAL